MISSLAAFPLCHVGHARSLIAAISSIPGRRVENLNHSAAEPQPKRKSLWSAARGPQLARFWLAGVEAPSAAEINLS